MNKNKSSIMCEGVKWDDLFSILKLHYGATLCEDMGIINDEDGYYCELRVCGTSARFVCIALLELYGYGEDEVSIEYDKEEGNNECIIRIRCSL